jgi:hypothetical protein
MKKAAYFLIILFLFFISIKRSIASENPAAVDNNKFGIHILNDSDLEDASKLVNSSGGDWGYVTLVIREDERDSARWQTVFDNARRLHLIPIIRLATKQDGGNWVKPDTEDITSWVNFLDSLNWVIKNRYIIIGNEPNHANEWGGEVNPGDYGEYFINLSKRLKISSPNYFVMLAGLDASAPDNKLHLSESKFLKTLILKHPNIFNSIDGWVSHSYPNPNFSAPPTGLGQKSVKTYEWELTLLRQYGITKNLPVFIIETGWAHKTDSEKGYLDPEKLTDYYKSLFEIYQNDSKVVAFTPFVLNYNLPPFDIFSWKRPDNSYYPFFDETQKILKKAGYPIQIFEAEIIFEIFPELVKEDGKVYAVGIAKNTGQGIWEKDIPTEIILKGSSTKLEIKSPIFSAIEPAKIGIILYRKL